ncbi:MAG: TetR/AcrR family transcriptional regulator [Actinomycetota bacterium]|nr:TetR/AcrR family transcriptional regulator [Actinomycetota bacterium]
MSATDRRQAILESALDVFSERGFDQASLDDVAGHGGVSKALIYEHFNSKRELQIALLDTFVHELIDRVVGAIGAEADNEARLRAGIESFLEFAEERPAALRLLTRNVADPDAGEALDRLREEAAGAVASMMVAEAPPPQPGDLAVADTSAVLAHLIAGGIQFMAGWWLENPRAVPRDRVVEVAMDLYWLGLERVGAGERWGRSS